MYSVQYHSVLFILFSLHFSLKVSIDVFSSSVIQLCPVYWGAHQSILPSCYSIWYLVFGIQTFGISFGFFLSTSLITSPVCSHISTTLFFKSLSTLIKVVLNFQPDNSTIHVIHDSSPDICSVSSNCIFLSFSISYNFVLRARNGVLGKRNCHVWSFMFIILGVKLYLLFVVTVDVRG